MIKSTVRFVVLMFVALTAAACGGIAAEPAPVSGPDPVEPAPAPVCHSSNTAPGCPAATSASWAMTCDIATPAPAVWCTMPEGDASGKVWCC